MLTAKRRISVLTKVAQRYSLLKKLAATYAGSEETRGSGSPPRVVTMRSTKAGVIPLSRKISQSFGTWANRKFPKGEPKKFPPVRDLAVEPQRPLTWAKTQLRKTPQMSLEPEGVRRFRRKRALQLKAERTAALKRASNY
jgi:hypothetical protein